MAGYCIYANISLVDIRFALLVVPCFIIIISKMWQTLLDKL
jgi:hypothetical protein